MIEKYITKDKIILANKIIKNELAKLAIETFRMEYPNANKDRIYNFQETLGKVLLLLLPEDIKNSENFEMIMESKDKPKITIPDGYGGTINCDGLIKIQGEIAYSIFSKTPMTSISKNKQTSMNNPFGEGHRFLSWPLLDKNIKKNMKYFQIAFVPNQTYEKKKGNILSRVEKVKHYNTDIILNGMVGLGYTGRNSKLANIHYDFLDGIICKDYIGQNAEIISKKIEEAYQPIGEININEILYMVTDIIETFRNKEENLKNNVSFDKEDIINGFFTELSEQMIEELLTKYSKHGTSFLKTFDEYIEEYFKDKSDKEFLEFKSMYSQ